MQLFSVAQKGKRDGTNSKEKTDAEIVREIITKANNDQRIINEDLHPEPLAHNGVVILIQVCLFYYIFVICSSSGDFVMPIQFAFAQVHDRVHYLKHLVESLSNVAGIADVLLIFSHDIYHDDINALVRAIKFCKVMQVTGP